MGAPIGPGAHFLFWEYVLYANRVARYASYGSVEEIVALFEEGEV
jgi:hypothetical protein